MTISLARICMLVTLLVSFLIQGCGGGGGSGSKPSDTTPDAFSFTAVTGVDPSSQQTSASITVSSIDKTTSVSISGGTFSINGAAFSTSGNVKAGDTVVVRLTASSSFATQNQATLTIGGVSAIFSATTRAADRTPDSFSFAAATNQNFTAQVESTGVTIIGIDVGTPVSVTGGEYAIGTGSFTSTAGTIGNNQSIKLRGTSAPTSSTATTVTVTVGTATQSFSITTTDQGAPQMTTLKLTDGADLKTATTLTAESTCSNCLQDQTQYSWYVEGVTNPVSTTNTYAIADAYRTSKITIVATPKSALGSGKTGSVAYKVNQVEEIVGNEGAFAALKTDGTVMTWGEKTYGGDSASVQSSLTQVKSIVPTEGAFAAIKKDGTVVTWGLSTDGGNSSSVQASLVNVESISATSFAFAALKKDGSVVTWGRTTDGGDSSSVTNLTNIKSIVGGQGVFAALKNDGTVVTWGNSLYGTGTTGPTSLTEIKSIVAGSGAFAAVKLDGSVVTWGGASFGGDTSSISAQLTNAKSIIGHKTHQAFAAIKSDDTAFSWGTGLAANSANVASSLVNVKAIVSSAVAFAALKDNGTIITWGSADFGGNSSSVSNQLINVKNIFSTKHAFAALKTDGTVVVWGDVQRGGAASNSVQASLVGVTSIGAGGLSFAALKNDGSVVDWGYTASGLSSINPVPTFGFGNTVLVESNLE